MRKEAAKAKAHKRIAWAEVAEKRATEIRTSLSSDERYKDFAFWSEPIKVGHHSEGKHRRTRDAYNNKEKKIFELLDKAKGHRSKAENLLTFANRNKGDAETARDKKRNIADKRYMVGGSIFDFAFRDGVILKVNKKTYTIRFSSGYTTTRDKSYFV